MSAEEEILEEKFGGLQVVGPAGFTRGMFVAVVDDSEDEDLDLNGGGWSPKQKGGIGSGGGMPGMIALEREPSDSEKLAGIPLYVLQHSFPFLSFMVVPDGQRMVRDVRDLTFVEVSREYAASMVHEDAYRKRYPDLLKSGKAEGPADLVSRAGNVDQAKGEKVVDALKEEHESNPDKEEEDEVS